jgi:hypothetical protein
MRHAVRQRKRLQAPLDSAAMLDKALIRTSLGAQLIACPPKHQARPADPCALVIFGTTGDLTKRLVVPALYNLSRSKVLPEQFALIGVARSDGTADSWRERLHDMLKSFVGRAGGGVQHRPHRRRRVGAACRRDDVHLGRPDEA